MAKRTQNETDPIVEKLGLIANLLALIVTKELSESDKIGALNSAGFSNQEIAHVLEKDVNTVKVTLFQRRNKKKKKN